MRSMASVALCALSFADRSLRPGVVAGVFGLSTKRVVQLFNSSALGSLQAVLDTASGSLDLRPSSPAPVAYKE